MSRRLSWIISLGLLCQLSAPAQEQFAQLKVDDTIYTNVTVMTVSATDIVIKHRAGIANLKLRYLAPALQAQFHYDPVRATALERRQDAATAQYNQAASQRVWNNFFAQQAAATNTPDAAVVAQAYKLAEPINESSLLNKPAPPLTPTTWYSEKPAATTDRFVVAFFWRSGSEACRRVIPDLNDWQAKFPNDLTVIGITTETAEQVKQATLPPLQFAYGGDPKSSLGAAAGITSVPTALLIDRQGIVRYHGHPGALNETVLTAFIGQPPLTAAAPTPEPAPASTEVKPFAVRRLERPNPAATP